MTSIEALQNHYNKKVSFTMSKPAFKSLSLLLALTLASTAEPQLQNDLLLSVFNQVAPINDKTTTTPPEQHNANTTFTREFQNLNSKWADGLSEKNVFWARLSHTNTTTSNQNWKLGIGRGGQIYSLIGPFGESVPPQVHENAPWMDEVWQIVGVSGEKNNHDRFPGRHQPTAYFIHGSGTYARDPKHPHTFYSPLLAYDYDAKQRAVSIVNWSQQAHVPTIHRSQALTFIRYRDAGAGIIEVTYLMFNYGPDTLNYFNTPWGGVRRSSLPEHWLSSPDGNIKQSGGRFGMRETTVDTNTTGGWALMSSKGESKQRPTLGIVFGDNPQWNHHQKLKRNDDKRWMIGPTRYRWGTAGIPERDRGRDYNVTVINPRCTLNTGKCLLYRMYFVVGGMNNVNTHARKLVNKVDYQVLQLNPQNAPRTWVYKDSQHKNGLALEAQPRKSNKPLIQCYAWPVSGTRPVFNIRDTKRNKVILTTDPYLLASTADFDNPYPADHPKHQRYQNRKILRPYDGRTQYLGLAGFTNDNALRNGLIVE